MIMMIKRLIEPGKLEFLVDINNTNNVDLLSVEHNRI